MDQRCQRCASVTKKQIAGLKWHTFIRREYGV